MDDHQNKKSNSLSKPKAKKEKKVTNLKKSSYFKCFINCCSFINKKGKKCNSKYSISCQFAIMVIPISLFLVAILIFVNIYFFYLIYKFNFYTLINEEYLKYLINDIEDANFELSSNEFKSHYEDIGNTLFFKIFFDELISLGLLDEDKEKIFPNVSDKSEIFYQFINDILKIEDVNSLYTFPSYLSKKYIDERNDSLSELAKVYFYFYPILSFEVFMNKSRINQTFLIAYQMDNNKNILGNEIYFNFPRLNDEFIENNIFISANNYIYPKISKTNIEQSELINNSYYKENWFIKKDYNFRKISTEINDLEFNFFHENFLYEKNINKSYINSLQMFFNRKGKNYIINVIYYIFQKDLVKDYFDYSLFIVNNNSNPIINKKFSDNSTYVINQNEISELALSSLASQYFHFGLKDNNYNFYKNGIFFDIFDVNNFYEPTKYYSTIKGFNLDIRYFSTFYLYTKLFQKSSYIKNNSAMQYVNFYLFNEKEKIFDVCNKFNFKLYKNYLTENNINCWDKSNLFYYNYINSNKHDLSSDLIYLPYCICLPLYCIKNNEKSFNPNNIQFVEEIILPEKCQNKLKFYKKIINERIFKEENNTKYIKYSYSLSSLEKQIEDEYIKFNIKKYGIDNGQFFMIISIFNNNSLKNILFSFINDLNDISLSFSLFNSLGVIFLYILSFILILNSTKKVENTIFEYKKKHKQFIMNLENKILPSSNENNIYNNIKLNEYFLENNKDDNNLLMKQKNFINELLGKSNEDLNINENLLLDELFKIYCDYYKFNEENALKNIFENNKGSKTKKKIEILENSNEIFKLFYIMSIYIPNFKLNINMDFNLHNNSKLINNYLKSIIKKSLNIYKEEIIPTISILCELLSTQMVNDYGLIINLNFNYITTINLNNKGNSIQKNIFRLIQQKGDKFNYLEEDLKINNNIIKFVYKKKSQIIEKIEENFEQDDYLQLKKYEFYFNSFLVDVFYNYVTKIESKKT